MKASEIAEFLGCKLNGLDIEILNPCSINNIKPNSVVFFTGDCQLPVLLNDKNILAIVANQIEGSTPHIITEHPRKAFAKVLHEFFYSPPVPVVAKTAIISESVKIGKDVYIGENTVIGDNVSIGDNTIIKHGVVISANCSVGKNCVIESNSVIGEEGFGFEVIDNQPIRIPHLSHVIIEDNVEIGACTVICRGTLEPTHLYEGCKIDGSVFIAHNVKVEKNAFIIANSIICGSAVIGEGAWISPLSTVKNKVKVGKNSLLGLGGVALKDMEDNGIYVGNPAKILKKK